MNERTRLSRRQFLQAAATTVATGMLAACGSAPEAEAPVPVAPATPEPTARPAVESAPTATSVPATDAPADTAVPESVYAEAPELAEFVAQGTLPPVAERLPRNPLVVEPYERVGQYGGTWRTGLLGGDDTVWLDRTIGYENLVRWNPEWNATIPNLAESFEANDEATEFVFYLREGVRWSDGEPFTADDILFWWGAVATHAELSPAGPPNWFALSEELPSVEKRDDYTVIFRFPAPNGLLLQRLATPAGDVVTHYPRHYMEQFHKDYNPDGIDALVAEAGQEDWIALFWAKGETWRNAELPKLFAWVLTTAYGEGLAAQVEAARNPYYWKVDPEGNQLPYLDRVVYEQVEAVDVLVLKALNGEIDMMDRHIATLDNKAVFTDNMQQGDYRFFTTVPALMNTMTIFLNMTHPDPVKREIFQNKDFRIGLSHAINRQELIDLIWVGQGEPWQAAPRPESELYNEQLAKQYTEYDVAKANQYLDQAGYSARDAEGFRLGPDGQRISFATEVTPAYKPELVDALDLVSSYWKDVGIDMQVNSVDRSLMWERKLTNQNDAWTWAGGGGLDVILNPGWYLPIYDSGAAFARAWAIWERNPDDSLAEEPPEAPRTQIELYHQLKASASAEQQAALMRQILELAAEQFYVIGINLAPEGYGIVKNNFRNVPETHLEAAVYPNPAPTNPCQYFIRT